MSVLFRVEAFLFDPEKHDEQARIKWLLDNEALTNFGGIKTHKKDENGLVIYRQRSSRSNKVDFTQAFKVQIDDGIFAITAYKKFLKKRVRTC